MKTSEDPIQPLKKAGKHSERTLNSMGSTVLLIDDDPGNLRVVAELLEGQNLEVLIARDGKEGVERARHVLPDLILLDVCLPELDGFEVCRRLKTDTRTHEIPVIFMTIVTGPEEKVRGFKAGGVDYITKPFQPEEVLARVATHLRLRALTESLELQVCERTKDLHKATLAYKALSECNQALIHAVTEDGFLQDVCRIIHEDCAYHLVWIGLAEHDEAKTVRPVAQAGHEDGYLETLKLCWADTERGRGPIGTAIRTGEPVIHQNILTPPAYAPWRSDALQCGYASSAAIPLFTGDHILGSVNIYATEPDAFVPEEVTLLKEIASDLAYGIVSLRMRAEHQQTEKAIVQAKEEWERTFDAVPDLIMILDRRHRIRRINRAMAERLKRFPRQCIGLTCYTCAHDTAAPLEACPHARTLADGHEHKVDVYEERLGGYFNVTTSPLRDTDGTLLGSVHVARDISDIKQAEEELRENAQLLRTIAANFPNSYLSIIEADFTVGFTSGQEFKKQHLEPEHFVGLSLEEVFGEQAPLVKEQYLKTFQGEERSFELSVEDQFQLYNTVPLYDEHGEIPRILSVVENITGRKQAEEALRKSEERYRELFDNMSSGVAVYEVRGDGEDFIFQDFNKAGERIDGEKREELIGRSIFEARPGIEAFGLIEVFKHVWKTGKPARHPVSFYQGSSLSGWYENFVYKLPSGEIVAVFDNLTEKKRSEEELQNYREHLEELVHERTRELEIKTKELEDFNSVMVGRELRMVELKEEVNRLCEELGRRPKYPPVWK